MTDVIAYRIEDKSLPGGGLTFCPNCAYLCTAMPLMYSGLGRPDDMADAIARMTLAQIERGLAIDVPFAVTDTSHGDTCENCRKSLINHQEEVA